MTIKSVAGLAFAAACLIAVGTMPAAHAQMDTQVLTNGPQANPGDRAGSWSAQQNVRESAQYDRLLQTNPGFRQARINKECGPITDPQLHADCLSSFAQDEPMTGSSMPPSYYRRHR